MLNETKRSEVVTDLLLWISKVLMNITRHPV
jgi:hypothetical protein